MSQELLASIVVSEIISIFLIFRIWRAEEYFLFKVLYSFIVLVPIVGPVFYFFVANNVQPQAEHLKNNLPRGYYTHNWLSMKPLLKKVIKEKTDENDRKNT